MFEIPADLAPECAPLAWLLGVWRGEGVGGYPTIDDFRFEHEVTFTQNGKPFLAYSSRSWILDVDGARVRPAAAETGYWRPRDGGQLEVLLSHPTGFAEIWEGTRVEGPASSSAPTWSPGRRPPRSTRQDIGSTGWSRVT